MRIFILGAPDPEMREIQAVLNANNEKFVFATANKHCVNLGNAYQADGVSQQLIINEDTQLIFVECHVLGLRRDIVIDHHNEGDPGYACQPADYLKGSSLGQVLDLLGIEPSEEQRIICAADHCPQQAYRGECPGVAPETLLEWRIKTKAKTLKRDYSEFKQAILTAEDILRSAEKIVVADTPIAWVGHSTAEMVEASALFGIPMMYMSNEIDGKTKIGILSAPQYVIETWMHECGLSDVYGNPHRGYAGGYA